MFVSLTYTRAAYTRRNIYAWKCKKSGDAAVTEDEDAAELIASRSCTLYIFAYRTANGGAATGVETKTTVTGF